MIFNYNHNIGDTIVTTIASDNNCIIRTGRILHIKYIELAQIFLNIFIKIQNFETKIVFSFEKSIHYILNCFQSKFILQLHIVTATKSAITI